MHLNAFLPCRLTRLTSRVSEAVAQVHAARFGLSRDEWRVLAALACGQAQPTRDVTAETGLDKVAISRAATALEDRGLILRSEDRSDRRIKILRLSPEGAELVAELERVMKAREAFLLEGLSAEDRRALDRLLDRLTERAEALVHPETAHRCRPDCSGACERAESMLEALRPVPGADRHAASIAAE